MERKIIIGDESKTKFLSTLEADVSVSGHTHTHPHAHRSQDNALEVSLSSFSDREDIVILIVTGEIKPNGLQFTGWYH